MELYFRHALEGNENKLLVFFNSIPNFISSKKPYIFPQRKSRDIHIFLLNFFKLKANVVNLTNCQYEYTNVNIQFVIEQLIHVVKFFNKRSLWLLCIFILHSLTNVYHRYVLFQHNYKALSMFISGRKDAQPTADY